MKELNLKGNKNFPRPCRPPFLACSGVSGERRKLWSRISNFKSALAALYNKSRLAPRRLTGQNTSNNSQFRLFNSCTFQAIIQAITPIQTLTNALHLL
jgi:hypothetical protein